MRNAIRLTLLLSTLLATGGATGQTMPGPNATLFVNNEIETANLDTGKADAAIALTGCTSPSGPAYDAKTGMLISAWVGSPGWIYRYMIMNNCQES